MELEIIMLSEISQTLKANYLVFQSYVESKLKMVTTKEHECKRGAVWWEEAGGRSGKREDARGNLILACVYVCVCVCVYIHICTLVYIVYTAQ
jgi:hypothetical protein